MAKEFDVEKVKLKMLTEIGKVVKFRAKELCPVDMGELRASIDYRIEGDSVIIGTPLDYATDMEWGKPPEPLTESEKDDIEKWAKRHGLKSGKGVIYSLEHKGIKAGSAKNPKHITSLGRDSYRPFLRPAAYQSIPIIKHIVSDAMSGSLL